MTHAVSIRCPACAEMLRFRNVTSPEDVLCRVCGTSLTLMKEAEGDLSSTCAFTMVQFRLHGEGDDLGAPQIPESLEVALDDLGVDAGLEGYREARTLESRFRATRSWNQGPFPSSWPSLFVVLAFSVLLGWVVSLLGGLRVGAGFAVIPCALYVADRCRVRLCRERNRSTFTIERGEFSYRAGPLGFGPLGMNGRSVRVPLASVECFDVRLQFGSHELYVRRRDGSEQIIESRRPLRELRYLGQRLDSHHRTYLHRHGS